MEPQSGVENESSWLPTKTKNGRKKSKFQKIIEKSLSVDDSFTRQISNENFADETASRDSVQDQTSSESQIADATFNSCSSNDNTNLTQSTSGYSINSMISSETGSCSSFAVKSRSGKNPKRMSVIRKKRYEKVISRALADSLNLGEDIPEEGETAKQQPAVSDQELTRNPVISESQTADTAFNSCCSNDSANLTQSTSRYSEIRKKYEEVISRALADRLNLGVDLPEEDQTAKLQPAVSEQELARNPVISESQTADTTFHSCCSNDNADLTQSNSGYSIDSMISSEASSCSSFAIKNHSGKNPKRLSAICKKKYEKVISRALADSLNLSKDIPEEDETAKQQPAVLDQEPTRNSRETKADVLDSWRRKSCMSKARSVIKEKIVSSEGQSAMCSEETGKKISVFGSKSDTSLKATAKGNLEASFNSLRERDVSKVKTTYPLDSKTLLLGKKEVAKKSVTDLGASCGSPDAIPSSQYVMETSLQNRPFACFEHLSEKHVLSASKDVSSASKDVPPASKDVSSASKNVASASKDFSSPSKANELETFPSSCVKQIVRYVVMQDVCVQTDVSDCSDGKNFTDASVQADRCDCPRLVGFDCSANVSTLSEQNLSRSERNCKNLNSGNYLSKTGFSKCIVPISPGIIYSTAEANKVVASNPKDVASSGAKANDISISSTEEASSDILSQMLSRIDLSESLKNLPDKLATPSKINSLHDTMVYAVPEKRKELLQTNDCNPHSADSANITDESLNDDEKTDSKALDRNELAENDVSPERLDISLQVSFASDGIADESLSRENLVDEIAATDTVQNLCNDSDASGPASGSNDTIIYVVHDVSDSETTDDSLFCDEAEKIESTDSVDRAPVHYIKTEAEEWEGSESGTRRNESLGGDLETKADELNMSELANEDSLIHDPKTDFRSISLQVSLSSDDISDESDATDQLESVQLEKLDKLLEDDKDTSVMITDDDKNLSDLNDLDKHLSVLTDPDDKSSSLLSDADDLIVPESPQLSAAALSPSLAAEDGEQMEQARNERQITISTDTPSEPSFTCSVHNVSLQVSLPSDDFNDPSADDLTEDYDRNDRDQKPLDLKEIVSPEERSLHQNLSAPQLPRNSNRTNCLFEMSDDEQSLEILPDDGDLTDHSDRRLSEVPGRDLCSTFLGRPSLESVRRADGSNWTMSPIKSENLSSDRRKSKTVRRVSVLVSNKEESTSESYMSANGSVLIVPDTSESDDEQGAFYKTACVEHDVQEEFVADSSDSQVHKSREKKGRATQVINVSDSQSSDDDDFENFLERVKTTEKIAKFSPPSLDNFVVDDSEAEEEGNNDEEDEQKEAYDDDDDDVIIDDDEDDDDRVFYYQVDNEREQENIDALSSRLGKALNFSLTSDSSDDDFQKVVPKRKVVTKKSSKATFHLEEDDDKATAAAGDREDAGIFRTPAPEDTGLFRTPAPVISKRRILSVITPKASANSVFCDKRQAPYTVGHAAPPRYSFLKSLSADVKEFLRDAKAARYVKNFKSLRNELTAELFTLFNREVFDSKIPSDMNVIWNDRLRRTAGFCRSRLTKDNPPKRLAQIELSVKVCDSTDRLRDTLVHEMCHAVVWLEHGSREVHGPIWKFWAVKANRALPDLPLITRCHSYDINTKFIYKCTKCGYEIGRHSKSLDTDKKICGHCHGQFELLVRPRNGSRPDSVPTTPRTPNKFALFVKENYGDIKKTQPGVTHKEIMAMIGARYSAKKTTLGED